MIAGGGGASWKTDCAFGCPSSVQQKKDKKYSNIGIHPPDPAESYGDQYDFPLAPNAGMKYQKHLTLGKTA